MIYIDLDKAISGELLKQELLTAGLETEVTVYTSDDGQKIQLNNVEESQRDLAESIYNAHNAPLISEPTAAQKLAAAGLTVDELKELLGL